MSRHFEKEIDRLKRKILGLSAIVEEHFHKSVASIIEHDLPMAREVIETDRQIDEMEVEVEEDCLKILALYHPVAVDLRYIVGVLKLNNDLERIGDLAVDIAKETGRLMDGDSSYTLPRLIEDMAGAVKNMLTDSLDALVNSDPAAARAVCAADDEVDNMHRSNEVRTKEALTENPEKADQLLSFLAIAHGLERIADHATNIAEDVIYFSEGEIVRHSGSAMHDGTSE